MLCLKIPRRVQIYSFVAFLLSCVFCAFGLSSSASAISNSCEFDMYYNSGSSVLSNLYCPDIFSSLSSSDPVYLTYDISITSTGSFPSTSYFVGFSNTTEAYYRFNTISNSSNSWHFTGVLNLPNYSYIYYLVFNNPTATFNYRHFILTLSDTDPTDTNCPTPPPCPDPVDPDAPYSNQLSNIEKAIYVCGAVLLVLYFFFCIYKIIVKDGGSR